MNRQVSPPDHNGDLPPDPGALSLVEVVNMILRHRRVLVIVPLACVVVAAVRAVIQPESYLATASFVPEAVERGGTNAAALARQFGISTGMERPGQSPEFYAELLEAPQLLRGAVESEYQVGAISATLVDLYGLGEGDGLLPRWRAAAERLDEAISTSVSRETGVVHLTVTATSPVLAEQIAGRLLELLNEFNLSTRRSQAMEESRFIAGRLEEAQRELLQAEEALKAFLQQNRQFTNSPELVFEHDRLGRQVTMRQEIFTSLASAHEQARIDAVRDTPVLTVISEPGGSAERIGRDLVVVIWFAFVVGLIIALIVAVVLEFGARARERDHGAYQEFSKLKAETWNDLRNPARILGSARAGRAEAEMDA